MKALETEQDVKCLVDAFYTKIQNHPNLGPVFNEIAGVSWDEHLPKMYSFWNTVLFSKPGYKGSPVQVHMDLSKRVHMPNELFDEWLSLFNQTVDDFFEGEVAELAKKRAKIIAWSMTSKINPTESWGDVE